MWDLIEFSDLSTNMTLCISRLTNFIKTNKTVANFITENGQQKSSCIQFLKLNKFLRYIILIIKTTENVKRNRKT